MWGRRILYLAVLLGAGLFYLWYQEWVSWVLLMWVLGMPLGSLLLSLPAMFTAQFRLQCTQKVQMGEAVRPELRMASRLPGPLYRYRVQVIHAISNDRYLYEMDEDLLTEHCGVYQVRLWRLWVYDYMGLFRRRIRTVEPCTLIVEPDAVPMPKLPTLERGLSDGVALGPGGTPELYELREYRPGDPMTKIHWKLAAKTGKLIVRQTEDSQMGEVCLALVLSGTNGQVDEKLGQVLWLGRMFLNYGMQFGLCCLTDRGLERFRVTDISSLGGSLQTVMGAPAVPDGTELPEITDAGWLCVIGGDGHEA